MSTHTPAQGDRVCETEHGWVMSGHPGHTVYVPRDGRWQFSGDFVKPTFSPSINEGSAGSRIGHHFFVRDGVVQYLSDKPDGCPGCQGRSEFYAIPLWDED